MSTVTDAVPSDTNEPGSASSSRRLRVVLLAFLIAVVVTLVSWRLWTSHAIGGVHVGWASEPVCDGTDLRRDGHTIEADPDMSCVITVEVRNEGPASVRLERAVLPFAGPQGGPVVEAAEIDGRALEPSDDVDAVVLLDRVLDPGEAWTFRTRVVFRDDGCTDAGTFGAHGWPTVEVSLLGRRGDVSSNRTLSIHTSEQNPRCRL